VLIFTLEEGLSLEKSALSLVKASFGELLKSIFSKLPFKHIDLDT